jgi:hypothetical protein
MNIKIRSKAMNAEYIRLCSIPAVQEKIKEATHD